MDLNAEKLELIKKLVETKDALLLKKIKAIFDEVEKEVWEELTPEQQEEINIAIQNENRGDVVDF
ncbi:hypothetical protein [Flavobacterium sp. 5]|uniref:hypothetical protein n=1 Tax=Flavobacterium sp. 5 TaxID=2035199 RepID=UPI000C2C85A2|nr:hypothetical protein [Flavobacterium sp. 5]PKB17099.1 hypothetical protein CLU82_2277 [Flavobacterium sp. 5]